MLTPASLKTIFPLCREPEAWVAALTPALSKYEINTKARIASFLAQTGYESTQFNHVIESLTYKTAKNLVNTWPKRFPTEASAIPYLNNDKKLGNFVYANRLGNGDAASGDGFTYRGRGIIQVTGRSNYVDAGKALGLDLVNNPDLLTKHENAALASAWFWSSHGLNALADDKTDDNDLEDFTTITKRINGGTTGLKDRLNLLNAILAKL